MYLTKSDFKVARLSNETVLQESSGNIEVV